MGLAPDPEPHNRNVYDVSEIRASYPLSLRALEVASVRVKDACQGEDIDAASTEPHTALQAEYDFQEGYFLPRGLKPRKEQNKVYAGEGGQVNVALVLVPGPRTHQLVSCPRPRSFVDDPHGMGAYGLGWIWKNTSGQITAINLVTRDYEKHVRWRLLWSLRDEAWDWFSERLPKAKARDGQVSTNDVHRDVAAAEIMARYSPK